LPPAGSNDGQFLRRMQDEVHARFPLLSSLEFSNNLSAKPTPLPFFIGLIATLLETSDRPICVVLPDCTDVAVAVATLVAATKLKTEFHDMLKDYATASFKTGHDHVLVQPCGLVYRYEGFFTPALFKLKVVDRNESRSLPVREIARLEKTTRKRPKGYLHSDLNQSRPSIMGSIVDFAGYVNRNFLQNRVLILGSKKEFIESIARWTILVRPPHAPVLTGTLKDEFPFGMLEDDRVQFLDGYVAEGEPLVAIASRAEDLAAHCSKPEAARKFILADDIERLTNDWRAYDSITEGHHTLLLATQSQHETVAKVRDRGCEVWRFSPDEILAGPPGDPEGPFHSTLLKATIMRDLVISQVSCTESSLDQAGMDFIATSETVARNTENGSILELFHALFNLLLHAAEYLWYESASIPALDSRLTLAAERLSRAKVWLPPSIHQQIGGALDGITVALKTFASVGLSPKAQALLTMASTPDFKNGKSAIAVTHRTVQPESLTAWLRNRGIQTSVHAINQMPDNARFDHLIVAAWPGADRFDLLVHQYTSPDVRILAYRFEQKWLSQYQQRYKQSQRPVISIRRKSQLLGFPSTPQDGITEVMDQPSLPSVKFDVPEEKFLRRRKSVREESLSEEQDAIVDAYYVDFTGQTFAYITEGHKLPVVNSYISGSQTVAGKIPLRAINDLKIGDYVMFRESGDSDIIRFIAEDEIGKLAYQQLRSNATRWRKSLRNLGYDPKLVWEALRRVGFARSVQTVRGWLFDQSRICPEDINDVRKIAQASHDEELIRTLPEVEKAKDELVSLHIRAGYRLTELLLKELPSKIDLLAQGETVLDMGVGKVRIVHIEEIDASPSPQRRSQVNRVLWDLRTA
jgi:hypothetical protein